VCVCVCVRVVDVICLERGADLHTAQQMPLPLTVSCFSKIQIDFTFLVLAHSGSPRHKVVKRMCVYEYVYILYHLREIASSLSKVADFHYIPSELHLVLPLRTTYIEFQDDHWH